MSTPIPAAGKTPAPSSNPGIPATAQPDPPKPHPRSRCVLPSPSRAPVRCRASSRRSQLRRRSNPSLQPCALSSADRQPCRQHSNPPLSSQTAATTGKNQTQSQHQQTCRRPMPRAPTPSPAPSPHSAPPSMSADANRPPKAMSPMSNAAFQPAAESTMPSPPQPVSA